jgi:hypothetical protein
MDVLAKLKQAVKPVQATVSADTVYVEKLASACEYAAEHFNIPGNIPAPEPAVYTQAVAPADVLRKVASAKGVDPSALLVSKLKEKLAYKQQAYDDSARKSSHAVVQDILTRLVASKDVSTEVVNPSVRMREKNFFEHNGTLNPETVPVGDSSLNEVERDGFTSADDELATQVANTSVEAVAAVPSASLADVLETARKANGTSESVAPTSVETNTKTAGARGKGPKAIGEATEAFKQKLLNRAGGVK